MAVENEKPVPSAAKVDFLVDENASKIEVPEGSDIRPTGDVEAAMGATSPANWWLYGVVAVAIVAAIVLAMQIFSGAPGSDVQPGTPTAEPVLESPAQ